MSSSPDRSDRPRYVEECPCGCAVWNEGPVHVIRLCSSPVLCAVAEDVAATFDRLGAPWRYLTPGRDRLEGSDPRPGVPA